MTEIVDETKSFGIRMQIDNPIIATNLVGDGNGVRHGNKLVEPESRAKLAANKIDPG